MQHLIRKIIKKEEIRPATKLVLLRNGISKGFFQLKYEDEGNGIALFDVTSFVPVCKASFLSSHSLFSFFEYLVHLIEENENYLFSLGEYIIDSNTVFVKMADNGEVIDLKILYIPIEEKIDFESITINLISTLKNRTDENGKVYLNEILRYVKNFNPSYVEFVDFIEKKKREIKTFEKY